MRLMHAHTCGKHNKQQQHHHSVRGRTSIAAAAQLSGPLAAANMAGMLASSSASCSRQSASRASSCDGMGAYTSDVSGITSICGCAWPLATP